MKYNQLTPEQSAFLQENFAEIQSYIKGKLLKNKVYSQNLDYMIQEASGMMPIAIQEFDYQKSLKQFIAYRCILRAIDQMRRNNKNYTKQRKIEKQMAKQDKPSAKLEKHHHKTVSLDGMQIAVVDKGLQESSWNETKAHVLASVKNERIKKILVEYLIPKIERTNGKTVEELAAEMNISKCRISQLIKDKELKRIMSCLQ
ncbi:MAG: hypothetical protein WC942_01825 [Clostridia bacterium]|jgi:hypothetical protein